MIVKRNRSVMATHFPANRIVNYMNFRKVLFSLFIASLGAFKFSCIAIQVLVLYISLPFIISAMAGKI